MGAWVWDHSLINMWAKESICREVEVPWGHPGHHVLICPNLKHQCHAVPMGLLGSPYIYCNNIGNQVTGCLSLFLQTKHYFLLSLKPLSKWTRGRRTFAWVPLKDGCHVKFVSSCLLCYCQEWQVRAWKSSAGSSASQWWKASWPEGVSVPTWTFRLRVRDKEGAKCSRTACLCD